MIGTTQDVTQGATSNAIPTDMRDTCPVGCAKAAHCEGCDQCDPSTRIGRAHVRGLPERETILVKYCKECAAIVNGGTHHHLDSVLLDMSVQKTACHMCESGRGAVRCTNCKQYACADHIVEDAAGYGRDQCAWCFRLSREQCVQFAAQVAASRRIDA